MMLTSGDFVKSVPGIFAYWNAENAIVSGTTITTLPDQSGNNQSLRNLTISGTAPTYTEIDSNFNDHPSISAFVASTTQALQATFDTSLLQPYTIYLVMSVSTNANEMIWRSNAGNFTNSAGFYINTATPTTTILTKDSSVAVTSVGTVANGNHVSCCVYDSANTSAIYIDSSATAIAISPGDGSLDTNNCAVMTIGAIGSLVVYSWASMICYSGAHSALQRKSLMSYLGKKYGIVTT